MGEELADNIHALLEKQALVLIGIDGLGGAGKSVVANSIKENIPNTTIVEMDDFYVPEFTRADWDRLYEQVIAPLKNNSVGSYQIFDWDTKKLAEWREVKPKGVVIIEGVYALHRKLRGAYDYKVWVEAPYEVRLQRGLERDGEEAQSQWVNKWMPKEEEYEKSQKPHESADLIIDGTK
ncbi:MAG: AAA family ATPase [Chloroflexi bacterium]|nr:AAA family ATPase [Chloroflexota bacterium]